MCLVVYAAAGTVNLNVTVPVTLNYKSRVNKTLSFPSNLGTINSITTKLFIETYYSSYIFIYLYLDKSFRYTLFNGYGEGEEDMGDSTDRFTMTTNNPAANQKNKEDIGVAHTYNFFADMTLFHGTDPEGDWTLSFYNYSEDYIGYVRFFGLYLDVTPPGAEGSEGLT